jgi:hypothetical protein
MVHGMKWDLICWPKRFYVLSSVRSEELKMEDHEACYSIHSRNYLSTIHVLKNLAEYVAYKGIMTVTNINTA